MLKNLNELGLEVENRIKNYDNKELILSDSFKEEFSNFLLSKTKDKIEFQNYTSVVTTSKGLKIIFPNQWFYLASFFCDFLSNLLIYKDSVLEIGLSDETIKALRENKIEDSVQTKLESKFKNEDLSFFQTFLTNYDWWFGSKTIDRGDFFVSSVLNLSKVVNVSHSYLADLAWYFSKNSKLKDLISEDYKRFVEKINFHQDQVLFSNNKLRAILKSSFDYLLENYGEEKILDGFGIKDSQIENRPYKGLTIPNYFGFEVLVGIFEEQQNNENLKSSGTLRFINEEFSILTNQHCYFTSQWNESNNRGLSLGNFNIFLSEKSADTLKIVKEDDVFKLIKKSKTNSLQSPLQETKNTIYYGAPGTGKSHKVDKIIKNIDKHFYERVTFHPEYDNASFIGGYKPITDKVKYTNDEGEYFVNEVHYKFVPQAFTNIYERAWQDSANQYYLVIEEINRGNCAEIFGEIFQLLDRTSTYTVSPSKELKEYLMHEAFKDENHEGIVNGLKLPPNLSILATMNTSDQSLFPMDSAFKRRWDWEYVPICYKAQDEFGNVNESFAFEIDIEDGKKYSWKDFIEIVNLKHIKNNQSLGMDKCIGNYFIKPEKDNIIALKPFINKVIFYLWNDVFKDEDNNVFEQNTSYEDFFPMNINGKEKIKELFDRIGLEPKQPSDYQEEESQLGQVAEPQQALESE
jgi:hypothetical protein